MRHERERGRSNEPTERRFGILLQERVSLELARLGVPHRLIDYRDEYARTERVELAVLDCEGGIVLAEFQYTLRRGVRGKIQDFVRAATVRAARDVPRVYLEIEDRVGHALKPMAERVAHAIRDIVNGLARFARRIEQGNVIGLALVLDHGRSARIFPMRLMRMIGGRAREMLEALLAPQALNEVEGPVPEIAAPKPHPTTIPRHVPFFLRLAESLHDRFPGFVPGRTPEHAATRRNHPRRMPFRR